MIRTYRIGRYPFALSAPEDLPLPDNMKLFAGSHKPEHAYRLAFADALPEPSGTVLHKTPSLSVYPADAGETRYLSFSGQAPYACSRETADGVTQVTLLPGVSAMLHIDPVFVSLLSLERHLIRKQSVILHTCFTNIGGRAVLFSGQSGCGKSTQGDLWVKHRGASVMNGDRSVLDFSGDAITANGFPVCGSSGICNAAELPVKAVVFPVKSQENRAQRIGVMQAFSLLYREMTVNVWDRAMQEQTMTLCERLASAVPVFLLYCTISEDAVSALENAFSAL